MGLENWQSVDELPLLATGISEQTQYRQRTTGELAELVLVVHDHVGLKRTYVFDDDHQVTRIDRDRTIALRYDATAVRDGIYLVDICSTDLGVEGGVDGLPVNQTWALDLATGHITATTSKVIESSDGSRRATSVDQHWTIEGSTGPAHSLTSDMVGHRVLWRYSDTDMYDHVYLNAHNFAWQCVAGVEKGLTELDRTRAYEIATDLFFFGWSEHVQSVESMLFVDLANMKTHGRMFGWEPRTGEVLHHQFSAHGLSLNTTTYPSESADWGKQTLGDHESPSTRTNSEGD